MQSPEAQSELSYRREATTENIDAFPVDHDLGPNVTASLKTMTVTSDAAIALDRLKATTEEILLAALVHAATEVTGKPNVLIDVARNTRSDLFPQIDLSRTVGCLTSLVPIRFAISTEATTGQVLQSVKQQVRVTPKAALNHSANASLSFVYHGDTSGAWIGSRSPRNIRTHALELNASSENGQLRFDFHFSENLHKRSTIEQLAEKFLRALKELERLARSGEQTYAASDFKHARLNEQDFTKLMNQLKTKH